MVARMSCGYFQGDVYIASGGCAFCFGTVATKRVCYLCVEKLSSMMFLKIFLLFYYNENFVCI